MNRQLDNNQIAAIIASNSKSELEHRQVFRRLLELLPTRLKRLESKFRISNKAGRAQRVALVDDEYEKMIDDIIVLREKALEAKIKCETHRMLLQARRSTESYLKVMHEKGFGQHYPL